MFGLRDRHSWDFVQFAVLLTQTILLYLTAGLVYPDFTPTGSVDLRMHYHQHRRVFFSLLAATVFVSLQRDMVLDGKLPDRINLRFHEVFFVASVLGAIIPNEKYHRGNALFVFLSFLGYIVFLFARLH